MPRSDILEKHKIVMSISPVIHSSISIVECTLVIQKGITNSNNKKLQHFDTEVIIVA
ncbi:MAG: hypothetical protein M3232_03890 [Thermoproteota archaeon]|nr:hypothetical protein [Thermoproteota archaeon]